MSSVATPDAGGRRYDRDAMPDEVPHARKSFSGPKCGAATRRGTACQQPAMLKGKVSTKSKWFLKEKSTIGRKTPRIGVFGWRGFERSF